MASRLAKRLFSFSPSSFHRHQYHYLPFLLTPLPRLSFSTQPSEQQELNFLAKYLISSLGVSASQALKVSKCRHVAPIKSEDQPESVVRFLKDMGLSSAQIQAVVSFNPGLLASNVEKTLKPKVHELIDAGFSKELLVHLIIHNPQALGLKDTLPRLLFWRGFAGNCDQDLLKIIKTNGLLIQYDIDKSIVPRVNLLNEYGFSNHHIVKLLHCGYCRFVGKKLDTLRQNLQFIEKLGISRESRTFLEVFRALGGSNKDVAVRKMEFFMMTYGWSQEDISSVLKKFPAIFTRSVDKLKAKMHFLTRKAMLEPKTIVSQPRLLNCNLEKRLVPRHHVLSILATKGLKKNSSLLSACNLTEKEFLEKFVEPYKKDVPQLADAYFAAAAGNIPV